MTYLKYVYARARHDQGFVEEDDEALQEALELYETIHPRFEAVENKRIAEA